MESIKIGDQIWSKENSIIKKFSNGEDIHQCTSKEDWEKCGLIKKPAWCYYDFDEKNEKYGLLYNGYVFMDNPGAISQDGFTSATYADWNKLADFIGGKNYVDTLKSSEGWEKVETDENDIKHSTPLQYSDDHGFKCIPSGWVNEKGVFYQLGSISKFWTDTDDDTGKLWARIVGLIFISTAVNPENGYSVRLIKE
jgi:uncharacterized protein (TIGR02145 family)